MSKQNSLSRAYFAAKRAKTAKRYADATAAAPKIYRIKKNGERWAIPMEQSFYARWENMEEAQKVVERMESLNPGMRYEIVAE